MTAGADVDVWGQLAVNLGRVATQLEAQRQQEQELAGRIWVAGINVPQIPLAAGAGTLDIPDLLGPHAGFAWAVHWVTAASFTAGTVSVYLNGVADEQLRFVFTSAGVWEPPRTSTILRAGDRLVFVAAGITGAVTISGQVTQMDAGMLPRFLV